MLKRIITLILAICIIFATSFVFASNDAGSEVKDSLDKTGDSVRNTVDNAGNAVRSTVDNAGNMVRDGVGHIENGIEDLGNTFSAGAARTTNHNNNSGYKTARTSTDAATFAGMTANTWVWFVMAIATVAIIALVWYYAMQNDVNYRKNNDE